MKKYLTVAEIAAMRGTDYAAAWRWLHRNANKHLRYHGRSPVISLAIFTRLASAQHLDDELERLVARVYELEAALEDLSRRFDALARRR